MKAPPLALVRRVRRIVEVAALSGLLLFAVALVSWPQVNAVETGGSTYPELRPRDYAIGVAQLHAACERAARGLPRWTVTEARLEAGEVRCEARTLVFGFVDDVRVRTFDAPGGATLHVLSASRAGIVDFGQNARNIRAFLGALDRELPEARYEERK